MDPSAVLANVSQLIQMLILVGGGDGGKKSRPRGDWQSLAQCLGLLMPIVEEWKALDSSPLLLLELALIKAKELLLDGGAAARNSRVFQVVCCEEIANWFHEIATMLDEALRSMSMDGFSDHAQAQAMLALEQLRRTKFHPDISDQVLMTQIELLLAEMRDEHQVRPDKLAKLFDKLDIASDEALSRELDALEAVKKKARLAKRKSEEEFFERIISLLMQMVKCSPEGSETRASGLLAAPTDFRCPLSLELMGDPVIIASGQTYERAYIQQWIDQGNTTCPKTRQILSHTNLIPNYTVKALITNWCEANSAPVPAPAKLASSSVLLKRLSKNSHNSDGDHAPETPARDREVRACTVRSHSFAGHCHDYADRTNRCEYWSFVPAGGNHRASPTATGTSPPGILEDHRLRKLRASPSGSSGSSEGGHADDPQVATPRALDTSINLSDYSPYNSDASGDLGSPSYEMRQQQQRRSSRRSPLSSAAATNAAAARRAARSITDGALRVLIENSVEDLVSGNPELELAAAEELRLLAKYDTENRVLIAGAGAIPPLVDLITSKEKKLQENAVTALLNLSINNANKSEIVAAGAVPPLVEVLKSGTSTARENSAAALFSLSVLDENKPVIGASGAIQPLVDLLVNGSLRGQKDAATALFNLSVLSENKSRIVNAGAVKALVNLVRDPTSGMVDKAVAVLANLMTCPEGRVAIGDDGGIPALVEVVEAGTARGKENAAAALLHLCTNSTRHRSMVLQEGAIPPLHALSQTGTPRAKEKAMALLRHFREQRHASFGSRSGHNSFEV
ncbi:U-box domain-containing protein 13-like isoform X1 [Selaginella moellendorffii]|uniref:U-box domain-containing protein 13-like isoform X1 n=2 Tax=Selaginella moellendorffii TaxID=88036 RepID=UPI000D1C7C15|nr:U-box domain-containing protein 13-like isoform X1 [Selaginella moellendorffii]|eukprot:XP_024539248.1 U-box domain-containing protein 13-like isoform X1 [Selaginella moellendorffii]